MTDTLYRIVDWEKHFENNRTRSVKTMTWIPLPCKQDGDGYTELIDHPDGPVHYACWVTVVQVASRCDPRGTLLRGNGQPHDPASLSRMTRIPETAFQAALPRLVQIGWLEAKAAETQAKAGQRHSDVTTTAHGCQVDAPQAAVACTDRRTTDREDSTGRQLLERDPQRSLSSNVRLDNPDPEILESMAEMKRRAAQRKAKANDGSKDGNPNG